MLIYLIDHKPDQLNNLYNAVRKAAPTARIREFLMPEWPAVIETSEFLEGPEGLAVPDAVFIKTGIPGTEGIEFVRELRTVFSGTRIILMTDTEAWAARAYELHVQGYVISPFDHERIHEEVELIPNPDIMRGFGKLYARCFGFFELFLNREPLVFSRKKTKELFAYLVSRNGTACSAEELISVLFEDTGAADMKKAKQNLRNLIFNLTSTLKQIGQEDILVRKGSSIAISPAKLDCDFFRLLAGDPSVISLYHGEFMEQYSWAENIKGAIEFNPEESDK